VIKRVAGLTAAAVLAAGFLGVAPSAGATPGGLAWAPCELGQPTPGLECATLTVPLDYANPGGESIEVAVSRLRGTNPAARRGVLVLNPGGQGDTTLALPLTLGFPNAVPLSLRDSYDLVAFDPRGIGRSTRLSCHLRPPAFIIPPPYAVTPEDVDRQADAARAVAEQCLAAPGASMIRHLTTANVARDMDRIRIALGEQRISYLGYSYGSYLGAVYATLFPERTDRVVLDSVVGPGGTDVTWSRRQGLGMELRFGDFASWAAAADASYGLGATPEAVRAKYFELAGRLDAQPLGNVTGPLFRWATEAFLNNEANFALIAQIWQALDHGVPLQIPGPPGDFDFSGLLALSCNQPNWPHDIATYRANVARDRARYPLFGAASANVWACAFWPRPASAAVRIDGRGPSNILLVNNVRDEGTPLTGALEMRLALGNRARLLTIDQGGHVAYLYETNACANNAVTSYLTGGDRPRDSFCPAGTRR
jgi:pimeloyl-ACP methyl ester carboxylesterase